MTTAKRTWQLLEQRVCERFGGRRTPLSGSNSQHGTRSDCINCTLLPNAYVEIKLRATWAHHTLFSEIEKQAKKEKRMPLLVTHTKGDRGELVTLRLDDFLSLLHVTDEEAAV